MKDHAVQLMASTQQAQVLTPVFDVRRNSQGLIVNGLNPGASQAQNEVLILASNPGDFKNSPTLGVGLTNALLGDSSDILGYRHAVRRNYDLEGLDIEELDMFSVSRINIKARYRK